jgi:hypothetical protein
MRVTWATRVIWLVTLAMMLSASALLHAAAVDDPRRDQVAAANAQALTELRRAIYAESIGDGYTVRDLIERTGTKKRFAESITRANQIGGPRWRDEICEVKLEIPGARVRDTLVNIATIARLESPIPPKLLQGRLQNWDHRKFSATGASMSPGAVAADTPRGKGVCDARDNAVAQTINAIKPVKLTGDKTVADALAQPGVGEEVERWLTARPITQIEYPDPNEARVALAVEPDELFNNFRVAAGAAAVKNQPVPLPRNENEWNKVREEFHNRVTPAVTRGVSKDGGGGAVAVAPVKHAAVDVPGAAPEWVERQLDAEGKGAATGSQLKAARAAEADAVNKLRAKLDPLPLTNGLTIGQAVAKDPTLENALDRALVKARRTNVDYQGLDSATVKVQLDLREVWREIDSASR